MVSSRPHHPTKSFSYRAVRAARDTARIARRKAGLTVSGSNVGSYRFTEKIGPDRQKSQTGRQKGEEYRAFQRIDSNRTLGFRIDARRALAWIAVAAGPDFQLGRRARNDGCGRVLGVMRLATKH
jgi:hypothetical protein